MWFKEREAAVSSRAPRPMPPRTDERRSRYVPTAAFAMADRLKRQGIDLPSLKGRWCATACKLRRPGRNGVNALPIVTDGVAAVMVDTMEHAMDLAGLLNWSGVERLDPVSDLVPPEPLGFEIIAQR